MFKRIANSLQLTADELINKVTWPTWAELQSSAIVTLIASALIALLIFGIDTALEQLFKFLYAMTK
jgi:preprotein translocase subunit SecE